VTKFQGIPNLDAQSNEVVITTLELGTKHRTRTSYISYSVRPASSERDIALSERGLTEYASANPAVDPI